MTNAADLEYYAKLWFGAANEEITVNPDTGSQYTTVCGATAATCLGTKYTHNSGTSTFTTTGSSETKYYGTVTLTGFTGTDRVCVTSGSAGCSTTGFNIFVITAQTGMTSAYSGIWGLSSGLSSATPTLLWQALKDNSVITNRIFCFGLRLSTGTSFLDMGSVILSNTKGGVVYYVPAITDFWWTNYVTGVKFGTGQNLDNAYTLTSYKAFTDTGAACTYIPTEYYAFITAELISKATSPVASTTWGYTMPCSDASNMDSVKFLYGDYWLEMLPADYLVDITGSSTTCGLCMLESTVTSGGSTYWVLGANFLRGFYTVYDRESSRIGFAALSGSAKDEPCDATCAGGTATATPSTAIEWWVWLIIAIAIVAIIVLLILFLWVFPAAEAEKAASASAAGQTADAISPLVETTVPDSQDFSSEADDSSDPEPVDETFVPDDDNVPFPEDSDTQGGRSDS